MTSKTRLSAVDNNSVKQHNINAHYFLCTCVCAAHLWHFLANMWREAIFYKGHVNDDCMYKKIAHLVRCFGNLSNQTRTEIFYAVSILWRKIKNGHFVSYL